MAINALVGDPGSGKSCYMIANLIEEYVKGRSVVANMREIQGFDYTCLTFEEFRQLPPVLNNAAIGWDELVEGADSYAFMHSSARKLNRVFAQIRKRKCDLWYTVQRISMIPRRMRILTNNYYLMVDLDAGKMVNEKGESVDNHMDVCDGMFEVTPADREGNVIGESSTFYGVPYYDYYNTEEVITDENDSESEETIEINY